MEILENNLITDEDERVFRVLFINSITSVAYVINMNENKFPVAMLTEELEVSFKVVEYDKYCRFIVEENLKKNEISKREHAWEILSFMFKKVNEEQFYIGKYRAEIINEAKKTFNISYNTIKNYLINYWKGGKIINSLLPNFYRCGGKGKERIAGDIKRGRRGEKTRGINIDENLKKIFKVALNRYYYNTRGNSLKIAYEFMLKDFFVSEWIEQDGKKIPILVDNKELPSYRQFLYWYNKMNRKKNEIIKRNGERIYKQKYRTIIGDATQDAELGPGNVFQIDSTIFDIYLVASFNRNLICGRPILYLVIDGYSRLICGVSVTFESFNSYTGAMIALYNAMTPKKEFCSKYGIEINQNDWVYCVPSRLLADRGEIVNAQIENAITNMGISIQNTPPYRADYKGVIEQAFHQMNLKIKPLADGVVNSKNNMIERGDKDYRLKANMTIDEFTKIIIHCVLFHNNHHVLNNYITDEMMLEDEVEKIPIKIWEHGLRCKNGKLRTLAEDVIKFNLLPRDTASITAKGVAYKKLLYASEYSLKNGWFQKARIEGNSKIDILYDPRDMSAIHIIDEEGKIHTLRLLEHLYKYKNKSIEEVEEMDKIEMKINEISKEKELKEKISLFQNIEDIVKEARLKTKSEQDETISKTAKLKGIRDNNRKEKLHQRELDTESKDTKDANVDEPTISEISENIELQLFKNIQKQMGDENE